MPQSFLEININEGVSVQLTEQGLTIYVAYLRQLAIAAGLSWDAVRSAPNPDTDDGWYHFEFWRLMQIFGPRIAMGRPVSFVNNVVRVKHTPSAQKGSPCT
jgi:hypothetical protein